MNVTSENFLDNLINFINSVDELGAENKNLEVENERLRKIETEAQKIVDAFRYIEQKQFELLGHGLEEACENWDESTNEIIDFSGLMQALGE